MLHYIHHPSGPIVLLTTSPYILLSHQATGWLTTPSFADVLAEHPEWREAEENGEGGGGGGAGTGGMCGRWWNYLSASVPKMDRDMNTTETAPLLVDTSTSPTPARPHHQQPHEPRQIPTNIDAIQYMTALERSWYRDRGYRTPQTGWISCQGKDGVFDYRLERGVWECEEVPGYEE
jgi:hypothetical protein